MSSSCAKLQALYDNEVSFGITTIWDGRFDWHLGPFAGTPIAKGNAETLEGSAKAIVDAAIAHFPESASARRCAAEQEQ